MYFFKSTSSSFRRDVVFFKISSKTTALHEFIQTPKCAWRAPKGEWTFATACASAGQNGCSKRLIFAMLAGVFFKNFWSIWLFKMFYQQSKLQKQYVINEFKLCLTSFDLHICFWNGWQKTLTIEYYWLCLLFQMVLRTSSEFQVSNEKTPFV